MGISTAKRNCLLINITKILRKIRLNLIKAFQNLNFYEGQINYNYSGRSGSKEFRFFCMIFSIESVGTSWTSEARFLCLVRMMLLGSPKLLLLLSTLLVNVLFDNGMNSCYRDTVPGPLCIGVEMSRIFLVFWKSWARSGLLDARDENESTFLG